MNALTGMLVDEYGVSVHDLHKLRYFWATIRSEEDVKTLVSDLAACPTTGAVNHHLKKRNNGHIGKIATKCKRVRMSIAHEPFVQTKTTQSTLFFAPKP